MGHCKVGAIVAVGMCESGGMKDTKKGVNWRLMGKVASMWVLTLAFASIISSSMFAVLTAAFHPMTKPLQCARISDTLGSPGLVSVGVTNYILPSVASPNSLYTTTEVEALFELLDTNNDDLLDDDELATACPPLNLMGDGEELRVEKFGRRRRRTPEDMDVDDFIQMACLSEDNLDHMDNKQCMPLCADGYYPDDTLKCKLDGNNEHADGSYMIQTIHWIHVVCAEHSLVSSRQIDFFRPSTNCHGSDLIIRNTVREVNLSWNLLVLPQSHMHFFWGQYLILGGFLNAVSLCSALGSVYLHLFLAL